MPDMPLRPDLRSARRRPAARPADRPQAPSLALDDRFFRHIVSSMRNGVIAFRRDGTLALMNDEGYRIFGLTRESDDTGRPIADVLRDRPAVIRVLSTPCESTRMTAARSRNTSAKGRPVSSLSRVSPK